MGCRLSPSTIGTYVGRIALAKLSWPLPPELGDDEALERRLSPDERHPVSNRPELDWIYMHRELPLRHVAPGTPNLPLRLQLAKCACKTGT